LQVGNHLRKGFHELAAKHNVIGDVRGKGLMLGIELVKDRTTKAPAKEECVRVFETAKDLGLLIGKGGLFGNTLRIKPPMCITHTDADFMLEALDVALAGL
jgi:alanine-glyoxylate transaminase / (R)-3-amino-2-methylpropionate-pyruvate transaminase